MAGRKPKERRSAKFEEKLEEIISIATAVFSEVGFKAGTTTMIAKRAGLTQPALYYYVGSKTALLGLICNRMGTQLREGLENARTADLPPAEKLALFLRAHTEVMLRETEAFKVYVVEARHLPTRYLQRIHAEEREYMKGVVGLVEGAQRAGVLPDDVDPWIAAQVLLGMMNWAFKWFKADGRITSDHVVETLLSLAFAPRTGAKVEPLLAGASR